MHTFPSGFSTTNSLIIFFREYGSGWLQKIAVTRIAEKPPFLQTVEGMACRTRGCWL